jgi:hypothetical protein
MSQQIQITGGAKVRNLQDVIIGTSGVLSSVAFDVANGVPRLDVNGKILVSQLPNSVMEYKGVWNAATNTPTLANGTGNQGDVYLCNVAGTVDFGAGPIAFVVGDQVIYSGSIWQRASGSTGTVTSVAITESGDSLNITGSPITTSGTINIGFNGTNLQYVNGAGNLTTFPTLMTSVGLTMPSAFTVTNSPLTGAGGTLAVTGAGVASQYIRGDGTLADFPSSGGGGSSVSYYLNGGTSQGTIGGVTYYEMSKTAVIGTGVDFAKSGDGFIVAFLTDANDPAQLNIPAGNWNYEIYASMSSNGGTPQMYAELYVYDGTTFTLIATSSNEIIYDGTALNLYTFAMAVPATSLTLTDRLAVKLYSTNSGGKTTTIHTQDGHLCQIITTFSTGITALNGLTAQVQYFQTGTSGTDFNISSTTATHTFNLPTASAANRGALSSADWSTFNGKQNALTLTTTGTSGAATLVGATLNIPQYQAAGTYVTSVTASAPLSSSGSTNPNITITQVSSTVDGYLSFSDYNVFSGKISGSGTAGYITRYTGSGSTIGNSGLYDDGTTVSLISRALSGSSASFGSSVTATSFVKTGGTSAQFLKADGSVDSTSYLPLTGGTLTGALNINVSSGTAMNVAGNAIFRGDTGVGTPRQLIITSGGSTPVYLEAKGYGANYQTDFGIRTYNNVGTAFEVFYADSSGRVGINQVSPSYQLDVNGTGRFSGIIYANANIVIGSATNTNELNIYATTSPTIKFQNSGADRGKISSNSNDLVYNSLTGNGHNFQIDGVSKFSLAAITGAATFSSSVTAGGKVTATGGNFIYALEANAGTTSGQSYGLIVRGGTTSTDDAMVVYNAAASSTFFRIAGNGNVGIGTTSPSQLLHLYKSSGTILLTLQSSTNYGYFYNDGTNIGLASDVGSTGFKLIVNRNAPDSSLVIASTGAATFSSSVRGTGFYTSSSFRNYLEPGGLRIAAPNDMSVLDVSIDNSKIYIGSNYYSGGSYLPISLYAGNFTQLYLATSGNVLIGTTTDAGYKLYVDGGSSNGMAFYSTSPGNQFKIAGSAAAMTFSNTISAPSMGGSLGVATSAGDFLSGTAAGDTIFINQFSGKRLYAVSYSGGVYLSSGATSWTANSDIRLKNINSHIENAVEKLSTLQTINFSYKDDKTNKQNLGLIAQEVEKIFPELIDKNGDGMLGVRYTELVPVLIKAVQELKAEIETLKNK